MWNTRRPPPDSRADDLLPVCAGGQLCAAGKCLLRQKRQFLLCGRNEGSIRRGVQQAIALFYGESLQYYIMEAVHDKEQVTESATLQKSEDGYGGGQLCFD